MKIVIVTPSSNKAMGIALQGFDLPFLDTYELTLTLPAGAPSMLQCDFPH